MPSKRVHGDDSTVWLDHEGVRRETERAKLFVIDGDEVWVPKSVIIDENDELVGVQPWWAEKNDLQGQWS